MPNCKADHNAELLHTDYSYEEYQVLGVLCHKERSMKISDCLKKNTGQNVWKEEGENVCCRKDPGSGRRSQRTGTYINMNAGLWPRTFTSNTCRWPTLTVVA